VHDDVSELGVVDTQIALEVAGEVERVGAKRVAGKLPSGVQQAASVTEKSR
jgi:hypothetical protein